jgi:hypothetical protein
LRQNEQNAFFFVAPPRREPVMSLLEGMEYSFSPRQGRLGAVLFTHPRTSNSQMATLTGELRN